MSRSASFSDWPPASDLANNSCIRSRVRNIRLIVLNASTLEAFVNKAGAAMNVTTANGLCDNDVGSITLISEPRGVTLRIVQRACSALCKPNPNFIQVPQQHGWVLV